jgi:glutamyl-tRNA synthetase
MSEVRVRFAPSPTGALHIGGVRTALYNYLFARQRGGKFFLRIEDTDRSRLVEGAEEYIKESLLWLGLQWDESPVRQSERKDIYGDYVQQLVSAGKAYYAFDTAEELEAKRKERPNFQYDATTRGEMRNSLRLGEAESARLLSAGCPYTVRVKIEGGMEVEVKDVIRGEVRVQTSTLDDKVLWKSSDGMPTYHLANVVDDHLMGISHVIRGEEWLPSAPLHVLLYRYLGWEETMPEWAHLSLLLKPEGNGKLSKRDGDRLGFPVFALDYREAGFLPEALLNFLALLGWSPGDDREMMGREELIEAFDLSRCSRSGAKFDYEKAKWFNRQYLQGVSEEEVAEAFLRLLEEKGVKADRGQALKAVSLTKERISFVSDLWEAAGFFFCAPTSYDEKTVKKKWKAEMGSRLCELASALAKDGGMDVKAWITEKGYPAGDVMTGLRLALVGAGKGPDVVEIMKVLGKEEVIKRIELCTVCLSGATCC